MQAIVTTLVNFYYALVAFLKDFFNSVGSFFNAALQSLVNLFNAITAFFRDAFASIKAYFDVFINFIVSVDTTIKQWLRDWNEWDKRQFDVFVNFIKDHFLTPLKSFFDALLQTIGNFYDSVITYLSNVIESLANFLIDLPLMVFKKLPPFVLWLFQWASDSCSYCIGSVQGLGSISTSFHGIWDDIASYGSTLLYCLNRAGVQEALYILTCGLIVWSAFKLISIFSSFVKAAL
ncbi:hypothetical protein [Methylovulum miyakonense]|uniref:hypothetical protein n=1 Tax=Methylovulum miyakonense TaxID=645578 RepID=UPI00037486B1|nr:hypothetical protein [Methylovulum miyakonense]